MSPIWIQAIGDVDKVMRQLLDTDLELRSHEEVLKTMIQKFAADDSSVRCPEPFVYV